MEESAELHFVADLSPTKGPEVRWTRWTRRKFLFVSSCHMRILTPF